MPNKDALNNQTLKNYNFLAEMYEDDYYPKHLVAKIEQILLEMCIQIEAGKPTTIEALCQYTHPAVEKINDLQDKYDSELDLETVARECMGEEFDFIATAYGFELTGDELEEIIATRDW